MKSKYIMYFLFALAVLILLVGTNTTDAASIDENSTPSADKVPDESTGTRSIAKNYGEKETKSSDELEDISLSTDDIECDYGDNVDINVVTTPEVDEGVMSWFINGRLLSMKNLSNSPASYTLRTAGYLPGNYEIMVSYSTSQVYSNNQTTARLKINKLDTSISNIEYVFNDDNDIDVTLNIMDSRGDYVDYGTLNVYYDSQLINSVELEDYDISFSIDKRFNGELLTFEFSGDEYCNAFACDELVYLDKFTTNIYATYMNVYYSEIVNESITFYSSRRVNDGCVNVYVDDVLVDSISVEDSSVDFILNTSNYAPNTYTVYIKYENSDVYEDAHYQTTLNIKQIDTVTYGSNITAHKNDIINLRAWVYNYVDQTDDGMIEFIIDNSSIKTSHVSNTTVTEKYTIPDNLDYGIHNISINYYGSMKYKPSSTTATLNITKHPMTLRLQNTTLDDEGKIVLTIRQYSPSMTVNDGEITIYIDNEYVTKANVTGNTTQITLPEKYTAEREYNLTAIYENSEKYDDDTLEDTFTQAKYETTTYQYANIRDNKLNITCYVYSKNYQQINEGSVYFYLDDQLISVINVADNRAETVHDMKNLTEKEYMIRSVYNGTKIYKTSQNSSSITFEISREKIYIKAESKINAKVGDTITVTATITDANSTIMNITIPAQATIRDNTESASFTNGTLNITCPANSEGTYNVTIKVRDMKYYADAEKTVTVNVTKNTPYITGTNRITSSKNEYVTINATLKLNGETLKENITGILKINNKTVYQGIFLNGEFTYRLNLNKYTSNTYNITIKSKETTKYKTAQQTILLELKNRKTIITSKNITSKSGDRIIITAHIKDALSGQNVKGTSMACIKINEVTIENVNVTNGRLIYSYVNNYSAKNYTIHIIYGETGIYDSSEWNGTLTILKKEINIAASDINTKAYNTINIRARLYDEGKPVNDTIKTVVKINEISIHEENVTNGVLNFNYALNDDYPAGENNITIITSDTRRYESARVKTSLHITKNYKQIHCDDISTHAGDTIIIRAEITDAENSTVTRKTPVNIKIDDKSIANMNVSDGHIIYEYMVPPTIEKGVHSLLVQAGQTTGYLHATKNAAIIVE